MSRIAVVVVTWNSARPLPGLLETLDAGLAGLRHELIIVDNASSDDTVDVATRLAPHRRIVQTGRNAGYAAGINAGVAAADPFDAVLVLNPDIRLTPGCVAALSRELGAGAGIAVPLMRHEDGSVARSLRREPTIPRAIGEALLGQRAGRFAYLGETVLDDAAYRSPGPADWATGAVMLISAECLAACGPWDESFFLYSEETEFALRARDHGYRTRYVPAAEATHLGGESRVSPALWSLLTVNRVRLYRMRHSSPAAALFWSAVLMRESSRALLGHPRSRRAVAALFRGAARTRLSLAA
jgi:N-acetylglucosaminyl-diphospho-decaprenol L-rhamnosyltransferase